MKNSIFYQKAIVTIVTRVLFTHIPISDHDQWIPNSRNIGINIDLNKNVGKSFSNLKKMFKIEDLKWWLLESIFGVFFFTTWLNIINLYNKLGLFLGKLSIEILILTWLILFWLMILKCSKVGVFFLQCALFRRARAGTHMPHMDLLLLLEKTVVRVLWYSYH